MSIKQIKVYAPASIANLGPGFDVFGLALKNIGDTLNIETNSDEGITLSVSGVGSDSIPTEISANTAGVVIKNVLDLYPIDLGLHISIEKGIPPCKGLGSSGACAAAAVYAICELLDLRLPLEKMVELASIGEAAVSGCQHADNVAASLLGGFTIVNEVFEVIRLDPPEMEIVVAIPEINYENKTRHARSLLPDEVLLSNAVQNIIDASRMVAAITRGDIKLFGSSIKDNLIEPYRAGMIPNFNQVKKAAIEAGAYGCSLAGGGPSIFAVGENPKEIGYALREAFEASGVECRTLVTNPSIEGVRTI